VLEDNQPKSRRPRGQGTQLPDGRWQVRLRLPDGRVKAFYGKTLREAQKKRNDARRLIEQGRPLPDDRLTVADYLQRWLRDVVRPGVRPSVYVRYEQNVRCHLIPSIGDIRLSRLTPQDVQAMVAAKQRSNLAPRTVHQMLAVLHNALQVAWEWGLVQRNVCDVVKGPKIEKREMPVLDPAQSLRLLELVRDTKLEGPVTLALTTGLRLGEVLGLRWEDVDLAGRTIRVAQQLRRIPGEGLKFSEPKSRSSRRMVALTGIGVLALERQRERASRSELVFPNSAGKPWEPRALEAAFSRLIRRSGLPPVTFHGLRHSTATLLLHLHIPPKIVQEILGHTSISITSDLYQGRAEPLHREAMDALNNLLSQPPERRLRLIAAPHASVNASDPPDRN